MSSPHACAPLHAQLQSGWAVGGVKLYQECDEVAGRMHAGSAEDEQGMDDQLQDVVMMRLRTARGLDLAAVRDAYGSGAVRQIEKALQPHERTGLVERLKAPAEDASPGDAAAASRQQPSGLPNNGVADPPGSAVRLSDPEGFLVSNDIISDVFAEVMQ